MVGLYSLTQRGGWTCGGERRPHNKSLSLFFVRPMDSNSNPPQQGGEFSIVLFFIFVQLSLVSILFIMLSMVVATLRAFANLYFEEISVVFFILLSCLILLISDVGLGYFYHSLFHYWGFSFFEEISGGFAACIVQFS